MIDKSKEFSVCPVCGGLPALNCYRFARDSEYVEIRCMKCGLTLKYDADVAYTSNDKSITFAPNISWSYMSNKYKTVAEVWNAGVNLI